MALRVNRRALLFALLAGPLGAWYVAWVFYYLPAQHEARVQGLVAKFDIWPLAVIGIGGALLGVLVSLTVGWVRLPRTVGFVMYGCLAGVAAVVAGAITCHIVLSGNPKGSPYLDYGFCCTPLGLILGGLAGKLVEVRTRPPHPPAQGRRPDVPKA